MKLPTYRDRPVFLAPLAAPPPPWPPGSLLGASTASVAMVGASVRPAPAHAPLPAQEPAEPDLDPDEVILLREMAKGCDMYRDVPPWMVWTIKGIAALQRLSALGLLTVGLARIDATAAGRAYLAAHPRQP